MVGAIVLVMYLMSVAKKYNPTPVEVVDKKSMPRNLQFRENPPIVGAKSDGAADANRVWRSGLGRARLSDMVM